MDIRKKILVIGSLNMDRVIRMKEMPKCGETVLAKDLTDVPGGKGANQACAIGLLGGEVSMLGCVGMDNFGDSLLVNLERAGVDITGIKRVPDAPTGTAIIYVDREGRNSIVVVQGANRCCDVDYLKEHDDAIQDCDILVLQMEIDPEAVYHAIRRGRELGRTIILNPAPAPDFLTDAVLADLDYITPNETELISLIGCGSVEMADIADSARALLRRGPGHVLLTLGVRGAMLVSSGGERLCGAPEVKAVDTTAAGDCFNGAFAVGLSKGMEEMEAVKFANMAAAISVTRMGAQSSLPTRAEVEAFAFSLDAGGDRT